MAYTRMGTNVLPAFESALVYAKLYNLIEQNENGLWLLTEIGEKRAEEVSKNVYLIEGFH